MAPQTDPPDHSNKAFGALSHPIRFEIVEYLVRRDLAHEAPDEDPLIPDDPRWVRFGELEAELDQISSSIFYHTRTLAQARLLDRVERGRSTYLRIRIERIEEITDMLTGTLEIESPDS